MGTRKYTKEVLGAAVSKATSISGVLRILGRRSFSGGSPALVSQRILEYGIDTSHFGNIVAPEVNRVKSSPSQILVVNHKRRESTKRLRRALLESGVAYECVECGMGPNWNGKELVLQIDHINGSWVDNRINNLRFLCPNCHTQQITSGRRIRRFPSVCGHCQKLFRAHKGAKFCGPKCFGLNKCVNRKQYEKTEWPDDSELRRMVGEIPLTVIAKSIGVSDKAVKKRCLRLGIPTVGRGGWLRRHGSDARQVKRALCERV